MILRVLGLVLAACVGAVLFYVSRFWDFRLWPREGLFGQEWLRPQGGLVGQWLRGTDFVPFELLIWAIGAILLLSFVQWIINLFARKDG